MKDKKRSIKENDFDKTSFSLAYAFGTLINLSMFNGLAERWEILFGQTANFIITSLVYFMANIIPYLSGQKIMDPEDYFNGYVASATGAASYVLARLYLPDTLGIEVKTGLQIGAFMVPGLLGLAFGVGRRMLKRNK